MVCAFDIETTKLPLQFPNAEYDQVGRGSSYCWLTRANKQAVKPGNGGKAMQS